MTYEAQIYYTLKMQMALLDGCCELMCTVCTVQSCTASVHVRDGVGLDDLGQRSWTIWAKTSRPNPQQQHPSSAGLLGFRARALRDGLGSRDTDWGPV